MSDIYSIADEINGRLLNEIFQANNNLKGVDDERTPSV